MPSTTTPSLLSLTRMTTPIRWLSTKEASEYLGVNLRTLYRFIDEGDLAAYKFGRVIRLKEDDVDRVHRGSPGSCPAASSTSTPSRCGPTRSDEGPSPPTASSAGSSPGRSRRPRSSRRRADAIAFRDLNPVAPTHVLVVPTRAHRRRRGPRPPARRRCSSRCFELASQRGRGGGISRRRLPPRVQRRCRRRQHGPPPPSPPPRRRVSSRWPPG